MPYSGSLHPEDTGNKFLRKAGVQPQHYTASQPTRFGLEG